MIATSRSIQPSTDPDLITVAGDIGDPETGKRLVASTLEKFGRIDTLVHNAGIFIGKAFPDYTEDDYRLKLKTNLDGFFTTQAVIPVMLDQGSFTCNGITVKGNERLHFDENGLIDQIEVAWRPLPFSVLVQEVFADKLGFEAMRLVPVAPL